MNSPDSVTISDDAQAVKELSAKLGQQGVFNRVLRTGGIAYHSHHMLPLGSHYAEVVAGGLQRLQKSNIDAEPSKYPSVPWISSVTPEKDMPLSMEQMAASYWRANLESPVRFTEAVSKLLDLEDLAIGAVIEIGPHPALKSPVGQIAKSLGKAILHVASLKRREDARRSLLELAGPQRRCQFGSS